MARGLEKNFVLPKFATGGRQDKENRPRRALYRGNRSLERKDSLEWDLWTKPVGLVHGIQISKSSANGNKVCEVGKCVVG